MPTSISLPGTQCSTWLTKIAGYEGMGGFRGPNSEEELPDTMNTLRLHDSSGDGSHQRITPSSPRRPSSLSPVARKALNGCLPVQLGCCDIVVP